MWPSVMSHIAAILAAFTVLLAPQTANSTHHHGAITGDLADALGAAAVQLRVPIVAELALPLPHGYNLPEGDDTAERC